ncbi:MAG TPA: hypothetical protein VJ398_06750, partial [Acidimicrobiia bacterium]|nr:hypothetical protein [Acidimicrobiia bacterium]
MHVVVADLLRRVASGAHFVGNHRVLARIRATLFRMGVLGDRPMTTAAGETDGAVGRAVVRTSVDRTIEDLTGWQLDGQAVSVMTSQTVFVGEGSLDLG